MSKNDHLGTFFVRRAYRTGQTNLCGWHESVVAERLSSLEEARDVASMSVTLPLTIHVRVFRWTEDGKTYHPLETLKPSKRRSSKTKEPSS